MHMIIISPTFYKKNYKPMFYDNTICSRKLWCVFFVNGKIFSIDFYSCNTKSSVIYNLKIKIAKLK